MVPSLFPHNSSHADENRSEAHVIDASFQNGVPRSEHHGRIRTRRQPAKKQNPMFHHVRLFLSF